MENPDNGDKSNPSSNKEKNSKKSTQEYISTMAKTNCQGQSKIGG